MQTDGDVALQSQVPLERHLSSQDIDERSDVHCGNMRVLHTAHCSQTLTEHTLLLCKPYAPKHEAQAGMHSHMI